MDQVLSQRTMLWRSLDKKPNKFKGIIIIFQWMNRKSKFKISKKIFDIKKLKKKLLMSNYLKL